MPCIGRRGHRGYGSRLWIDAAWWLWTVHAERWLGALTASVAPETPRIRLDVHAAALESGALELDAASKGRGNAM